jgi:hypothetical protein
MRAFHLWLIVAMVVYLGAAAAVKHREALPAPLPWILLLTAALLSGVAVWRYVLYLRASDELKRKVEVEALAIGFGVGAVLSLMAPLAARLGFAWLDEFVVATAMMLSWALASFLGNRRYSGPAA